MNAFIQELIDYFFPLKCVACKTLISRDERLICKTCADAYREATQRLCPVCVKPLTECDCPNRYMERNNLHTLVKLYRYQPGDAELAENRMIYRLKQTSDISVVQFLAAELAPGIRRHIKPKKEYVLVGVPRSKKAIRKFGDDHICLLCRELSKILDIPYLQAVKRRKSGKAQKQQGRKERLASAAASYYGRSNISLKGKTVILVDDVATTGASLVACTKILRKMGARTVICAVAGVAFRYHDMIKDSEFYTERRSKYGV